ncbi:MAG: hypothetical protein R6U31_06135 [bacterium]
MTKLLSEIYVRKPGFTGLLLFCIIPLFIFPSVREQIDANYQFDNISFFYYKTITDTNDVELGRVTGKVYHSPDSTVSYFRSDSHMYKMLHKGNTFTVIKDMDQVEKRRADKLPFELDIISLVNPLSRLSGEEEIRIDSSASLYSLPGKVNTDSIALFTDSILRIDSVYFYKGSSIIAKNIYRRFRGYFPLNVISYDYQKNIKETIIHYNILLDKNTHDE